MWFNVHRSMRYLHRVNAEANALRQCICAGALCNLSTVKYERLVARQINSYLHLAGRFLRYMVTKNVHFVYELYMKHHSFVVDAKRNGVNWREQRHWPLCSVHCVFGFRLRKLALLIACWMHHVLCGGSPPLSLSPTIATTPENRQTPLLLISDMINVCGQ